MIRFVRTWLLCKVRFGVATFLSYANDATISTILTWAIYFNYAISAKYTLQPFWIKHDMLYRLCRFFELGKKNCAYFLN